MFFRIKNELGMSMVGVMISAAMLGGLSLVVARIGENTKSVANMAAADGEINEVANRIEKYFLNHDYCKATLSTTIVAPGNKVNLPSIKTVDSSGNEKTVFSSNPSSDAYDNLNHVRIIEMTAERDTVNQNLLTIEVTFEKTRKNAGAKHRKKRFELDASFFGDLVTKCYSQMDNAVTTACINVGGEIVNGDCVLTPETKAEIVTEGIQELIDNPDGTLTPLYENDDGALTKTQTYDYTKSDECTKCGSSCSPPSCTSGFSSTSIDCSKATVPGRCGFRKRYTCRRNCQKAREPASWVF